MLINTIEALQQLYVALGGDIADVQNITITPEMISALTEVAAAAASELPAVKSADNGKVLTVVSGKWAKADAPTELPAVTNVDDGNVLGVVSGNWAKMTPPTELPSVTSTDNGKLLGVKSGQWNKVNAPTEFNVKHINASGTTAGNNVSITFPSGVNRGAIAAYDGYDTTSKCALCVNYNSIYLPFVSTDISNMTVYFSGIGKVNNTLSKITVAINTFQASNDAIYVEEITFS